MLRSAGRRFSRPALLASASFSAAVVTLHEDQEKLSIYPQPDSEIVLLDTPSGLEKQIGTIRRSLTKSYLDAHGRVQDVVSKWIGIEHAVEHRVKSLISPTEPLTPGLLYVGIATLTGSVLARNRSMFTRVLLPPTLLILSAEHFLPQTSHNVSEYFGDLEDAYMPGFSQKHEVAKAHTLMTWEQMKSKTKDLRGSINNSTQGLVRKTEELTGLKFRETLGWGESNAKPGPVAREVQKKVEEARAAAATQVNHAKEVTVAKIEEAKVAIEEKVEQAQAVVEEKIEHTKNVVEEKTEHAKDVTEEKANELQEKAVEASQERQEPPIEQVKEDIQRLV